MFIPASILVIIVIIYLYERYKISDEISSLRNDISDLNPKNNSYYAFEEETWEAPKQELEENPKDEYTLQESQDRGILGVNYNTPFPEIRKKYLVLAKDYQESDHLKFTEITQAYKRLQKKYEGV